MPASIWTELAVVGALIWLGYLGARLVGRFKLPAVTGFLLMGVALGPHGLGLLSFDLLDRLGPVQTLALGLIVFLIGEELTGQMLRRHHWSFWVIAVAGALFPAALAAGAALTLFPEQPLYAWLLGAIAISGAPATLMAVIAESKVTGRTTSALLGANAFHDIATVVAYSLIVPFLLLRLQVHASVTAALSQTAREIGGALILGALVGWILSLLLRQAADQGELLALGLTHVLVTVAIAEAVGASAILAPLVMGVTVAISEERRGNRERCFRAIRTVEYPVYIIFFTLAGAELELTAVLGGGVLMIAYIAARGGGKFLAGFLGGLLARYSPADAAWFGLGLFPQAGVAVGLALSASSTFPQIGPTVNAVVLGSIVFFEAVGPLAARKAVERLGTQVGAEVEAAEGGACRLRVVMLPVSATMSLPRLLEMMHASDTPDECPTTYVLAHVYSPERAYTPAESGQRSERLVAMLAEGARTEGYSVTTRVERSRNLEQTLARIAEEERAELVVLSARAGRTGMLRAPLRRRLHRVLDAISVPVMVVPEGSVPECPIAPAGAGGQPMPEAEEAVTAEQPQEADEVSSPREEAPREEAEKSSPEAPASGGAEP